MVDKKAGKLTMTAVPPAKPIRPAAPKGTLEAERQPEKIPYAKVAASLSNLASGWNADAEKALSMPPELYTMRNGSSGATFYSAEPQFPIADFLNSLRTKPAPPQTRYGIAVYETASTVYLVVIDAARRVAVRVPLANIYDAAKVKSWGSVVDAIRMAEAAAKANPGKFAFHDGAISLL
ncbi:hypothetical protein L0Y65_01575 [Candidatus Micrarchaeota archaeon]|nr:hypothetical protein [Candidatus Micrarchaeota archaeon]